jgi:hypothetical protein
MARRRNLDLDGPFVLHSLEMRESAAWHALSDKARRILDRLEVEHMMHGGGENGNLICTYDDFRAVGIRRQSIPHAIRECVALGFLEVTLHGGLTITDIKRPSRYRLTYVMGRSKSPDPTHEWKRIKPAAKKAKAERGKIFSPGCENGTATCRCENGTVLQVRKRYCRPGCENGTAIYISGGGPL